MGRFGDERRRYCGPLVMMLMPENRYLDREYVRRLADTSLRIYAYFLASRSPIPLVLEVDERFISELKHVTR